LSILRSSKSFQEDNREEAEEVGGLERVSTISFGILQRCIFLRYFSDGEIYTPGILSSPFHSFSLLLPGCSVGNLELQSVGQRTILFF